MAFVDIALVEIDDIEMETIKALSVNPSNPKTPVKTMNRDRVAKGYTQGIQEFGFKLTVAVREKPEIDWHGWVLSRQRRRVVYEQADNGLRVSLGGCVANSIDEKYDQDGEAVYEIDCMALTRRED